MKTLTKAQKKHISYDALILASVASAFAAILAIQQGPVTYAATTTGANNKIPSSLTRFKEILNKNLDISVSSYNKNYLSYIGTLEETVPLKVADLKNINDVGLQFIKEYGKHLGVTNSKTDLKINRINKDGFEQNYIFYRQYYKGIPVYGGEIVVQVGDDLKIRAGLSKFIPGVSSDTKPKVTKERATTLAKTAGAKSKMSNAQVRHIELVVYNPRVFDTKVKSKNYLAWNAVLEDDAGWLQRLFLDAKTGKVIAQWPLIKTGWFDDLNIETRDILGTDEIRRRVYDCRPDGCTQNSTATSTIITDPATSRDEGAALTGDADIDDLYDILAKAFAYYKDIFNYWGANGYGGMGKLSSERWPLQISTAYTHVIGTSTLGRCDNAWGGGNKIMFCAGVVNTAAVGHEYTHVVSDFNKPDTYGFDYIGESGAIEEAFADIFGQAIMRYADGASTWEIGPLPSLWRNIVDPTNPNWAISGSDCPCPTRQYGPEFYCGARDLGGVHVNSTVASHLAYILSVGGNNGCDVKAIGQEKMEQLFYHAFRHNLPSAPTYTDLYTGLIRSCNTIFGIWSDECRNVALAMQGAEMDQDLACGSAASAPKCKHDTIDPRGFAQFGIKKLDLKFKPKIKIDDAVNAVAPITDEITAPLQNAAIPTSTLPNQIDAPTNFGGQTAETPAAEEEVRTPSFSISLENNLATYTITGKIDYYGKGNKCSGPRPYDPVIVRWGDGADEPKVVNGAFSATHQYKVKNKSYTLTVSVYNSCYGMKSETREIKPTI